MELKSECMTYVVIWTNGLMQHCMVWIKIEWLMTQVEIELVYILDCKVTDL